MSSNGRGKLAEAISVVKAMAPEQITNATVYWNGQSVTTGSGHGIDTQPYDDVEVVPFVGTVLGASASLTYDVYHSDTDNPMAAELITGASFTDFTASNDEQVSEGSVLVKDQKRYLFVRMETSGAPLTIHAGAIVILGKADSQAVSKTLDFDL